ncbi:hypothetical protein FRB99_008329 [Tulasnella sp. 403]|nr:hypothetical protein FRB99_008329 [Tulasnella sp. 403]
MPLGPFCDSDIFPLNTKGVAKFNAPEIYLLRILVEIDGKYRIGGIDDIEGQRDRNAVKEEDREDDLYEEQNVAAVSSRSQVSTTNLFTGIVFITNASQLSDRGKRILKFHGCDLRTLDDQEGAIQLLIQATLYRYEYSGVSPASAGPPKRVHKGDIGRALGADAEFFTCILRRQKPQPMDISLWMDLKDRYERRRATIPPPPDSSEEEEEVDQLDEDEYMGVGPGPTSHTHSPAFAPPHWTPIVHSPIEEAEPIVPKEEDIDVTGMTNNMESLGLPSRSQPDLQIIRHTPKLSLSSTYECPFDILHPITPARPNSLTDQTTKCSYIVDFINPSPQCLQSLPTHSRKFVESRRFTPSDPRLGEAFAFAIHEHVKQHQRARTRIRGIEAIYEVVIQLPPREDDHRASAFRGHYVPSSDFVVYRWEPR